MRWSDALCGEGLNRVVWMGALRGTRTLGRCWVCFAVDDDPARVVSEGDISL